MTAPENHGPAVYEVTVTGSLGPVLSTVLEPYVAGSAELCTILRTRVSEATDLVDLVLLLESSGLDFTTVAQVS